MISLFFSIVFPFLFLIPFLSQYAIFQAQHYEINKYFNYEKKKKIINSLFSGIVVILSLLFDSLFPILLVLSIALVNVIFINKHKLKYTSRVKRTIVVYFLISYCIAFLSLKYLLAFLVSNLFLVYISLIHFVCVLIEKCIRNKFKKEAKRIIKDKIVIGITGSYGKTSSKNIVYDMLSYN